VWAADGLGWGCGGQRLLFSHPAGTEAGLVAYCSMKQPESRLGQQALLDDASPSAPVGTFNGDGPLSTLRPAQQVGPAWLRQAGVSRIRVRLALSGRADLSRCAMTRTKFGLVRGKGMRGSTCQHA
jgi:hypothetical protein